MPRSKRAKVVHLSKTEKKGKELTLKLYATVQEALDKFEHCFVFSVENMRNTYLKDVRTEFLDSRICFGKTKVMAKAIGSTPEDEYKPNLRQLSKFLVGNVGLLFTSRPPSSVIDYFNNFSQADYARSGNLSTRKFTIPAGIVYTLAGEIPQEEDLPLPHSLEPTLRSLGVPSRLVKGKVELGEDFVVCEEGQVLDSRQTRLLKMFGVQTANFKVQILAYWSAETESVTVVDAMEE